MSLHRMSMVYIKQRGQKMLLNYMVDMHFDSIN
jgi:hypothetical protein